MNTYTHTHASVCLKSFLWLHLRHGATTHAWNHLCRHTSINQHRKDVWHHETTRFTTQAESSKCFHTELYSSALLTASFTCLITLLWFCYLYFMYSMCVCCVCVCNVRCFLGLMPQFCHFVWYQTFNTPHNKLQWCFFFHILHIRDMFEKRALKPFFYVIVDQTSNVTDSMNKKGLSKQLKSQCGLFRTTDVSCHFLTFYRSYFLLSDTVNYGMTSTFSIHWAAFRAFFSFFFFFSFGLT